MPQGFNPYRHTVSRTDEARWASFSHAWDDPLPTDPKVLPLVVQALRGRLMRMTRTHRQRQAIGSPHTLTEVDHLLREVERLLGWIYELDRTRNKQLSRRIRLYLLAIAQRCHSPGEIELNWFRLQLGHYEDLFHDELREIQYGRLLSFGCLPAVLRLQRDHLYEYMSRSGPDGYERADTPLTWLQRNQQRLYEELVFYRCACTYRSTVLNVACPKRPGELIPVILAALHSGCAASSIRQILKRSSRPAKLPAFLR